MENKYFAELARRLRAAGITAGHPEKNRLTVLLNNQPVLSVSAGSDVFLLPAGSNNMEASELYAEALRNLEQVNWKVDCILSHCGPSSVVRKIDPSYGSDQLTDFLETVNQRCQFTYWFFGHYHDNRIIDDRYILQWEQISGLEI